MSLKLRRRTAGIVIGVALGLSSLTACAFESDNVATIGNQTITTQEYQSALDEAYADPIIGKKVKEMGDKYRTVVLNDLVSYDIARAVASNAGVKITDAEIDTELKDTLAGRTVQDLQLQTLDQDPITETQLRMRLATDLVTAKFGETVTGKTQKQLAAQKLETLKQQRTADPAQYTTYAIEAAVTYDQALAQDWVTKANGGMTLQAALDSNPDPEPPTGQNKASSESYTGADLASQPDVLKQLQAIAPGTTGTVVQGPDPTTGKFVYIVVTMVSAAQTSDAELQTQADQQAQQEFYSAGATEAAAQAKKLEIDVNPRYGTVEYPQQGLPSVTVPSPKTFSEPSTAPAASTTAATAPVPAS